ncbi:MAG: RNA methyltransferase [Usitatibacteraceae bacterium]
MLKAIRSRDNTFVKQLVALAHSSRERKKAQLSVLDGIHLIRAYVDAAFQPVAIAVSESAEHRPEVLALLSRCATAKQYLLADTLMTAASALDSPAFMMAIVPTPVADGIPEDADVVLALEDVQDPGNVGSMLRSAAAAGVRHVALSKTTAFAWSPKVLRAAQGAHFSLNIEEGIDLLDFAKRYRGQSLALVAQADSAKPLFAIDLCKPTLFLIGNEGAGLSNALVDAATHRVTIPMPGKIESLNAAAAGAICLFEFVRQRFPAQ